MRPLRIVIPAGENSFHHAAAEQCFGAYHGIVHAPGMAAALDLLEQNRADYAVLAAKNSIAGIIEETYRLLRLYRHVIIGEISLPVSLCLAGHSRSSIERITAVVSNRYALLQAGALLSELNISEQRSVNDTALAARIIAAQQDVHSACICSPQTAEKSGLHIHYRDVQKRTDNRTSFLIISKSGKINDAEPPASLKPIYISL